MACLVKLVPAAPHSYNAADTTTLLVGATLALRYMVDVHSNISTGRKRMRKHSH